MMYLNYPAVCPIFDINPTFIANDMCCECGGGVDCADDDAATSCPCALSTSSDKCLCWRGNTAACVRLCTTYEDPMKDYDRVCHKYCSADDTQEGCACYDSSSAACRCMSGEQDACHKCFAL
jgi:hypothetical protein